MLNNKTVLITGASGFLGSHLSLALLKAGCCIVAYKRKTTSLWRFDDKARFVDWFDVEKGIHKPFEHYKFDFVVHTATNYGRNQEDVVETLDCNLMFPMNVLRLAKLNQVHYFINTDTSINKFINGYALSKKQFSEWLEFLAKDVQVINIVLEYFYGPNDDAAKFIWHLVSACKRNDKEIVLTKGEQVRDFIYIDDVINAYLLIMEDVTKFKEIFTNIPLGSGYGTKIYDLCKLIKQKTNSKTELLFGQLNYRKNEQMYSVADISLLKKLGWLPQYSLEKGIEETIKRG